VRVGADVEVLRHAGEQQVADAASDQVPLESGRLQTVQNLERVRIDQGSRDRMLRSWTDAGGGFEARFVGGRLGRGKSAVVDGGASLSFLRRDSSLRH